MKNLISNLKRQISLPYTATDKVASILSLATGIVIFTSSATNIDKLIGLTGVLIILLRTGSKLSFIAAFIFLINVPLLSLISRQSLSESFAVYALYFMFIGIVSLSLEDQPYRDYLSYRSERRKSISTKSNPETIKRP